MDPTVTAPAVTRAGASRVLERSFRDVRGKQLVLIDGLTRSNAGAVIGEKVTLTVVRPPAAQRSIRLRPGASP
jgi:hypothetical protein